jgi:cytochrome oxidase Cu insertion factor (SCO1/SenC/PrrC family)
VIPVRALTYVVALCALFSVGCGSGTGEEAGAPTTSTLSDASSRSQAPAIDGISLEGKQMSLDDFRGRPVLVNVWSSW